MPRISYVTWPAMNLTYGYMFDIRSEAELLDYWTQSRSTDLKKGFADYCNSAEWANASGIHTTGGHICSSQGGLIHVAVQAEQLKESNRRSLVVLVADINDSILHNMLSCINEHGQIFVNSNGGYFTPLEDFTISHEQEIETYSLPGSKIVVSRWPNGTHWYARIGSEDVVMNDINKWNTKEEAERMAKKFAASKNIRLE